MAHRNRWFTVLKNGWIFHGELLVMLQEALHLHFASDGQAWPRLAASWSIQPPSTVVFQQSWHPQGSKVAWFSPVKFMEFPKNPEFPSRNPGGFPVAGAQYLKCCRRAAPVERWPGGGPRRGKLSQCGAQWLCWLCWQEHFGALGSGPVDGWW